MAINIVVQLVVGLGLAFLGYVLMPKPEPEPPPEVSDLEEPSASAGEPILVVFGSKRLKAPNLIGAWDKDIRFRTVSTAKK